MSNKPQSHEQQASNSLLIEQRRVDVYNATVQITYALRNQYPVIAQPQTAQVAPASFTPEQPVLEQEQRTVNQAVGHKIVSKLDRQRHVEAAASGLQMTISQSNHLASAQLEVSEALDAVATPDTAVNRADTHEFGLPTTS